MDLAQKLELGEQNSRFVVWLVFGKEKQNWYSMPHGIGVA